MMRTEDIQIRDPFVLVHEGRYYLYGSTDKDIWKGPGVGFDVYFGDDLTNWSGPLPAFRPPGGFWGARNFWAPEVYNYGGSFFMFASFIGQGHMRGTAVLRSQSPEGPFTPWSDASPITQDCAVPLQSGAVPSQSGAAPSQSGAAPLRSGCAVTPRGWMCLDGTLYIDQSGDPWLVFCHEWVQIGDGEVCAMQLVRDLSGAVSEPSVLFTSKQARWSRKAYSPSNNIEGYVTDGCFPYRLSSGVLLMLWSCMGDDGYCLGYAASETGLLSGPWVQAETPLFASDGGHGMIFRALDGRLMLALHRPNDTPRERAVFIGIEETETGLVIVES